MTDKEQLKEVDKLMDLFQRKEDLHEDLEDYLEMDGDWPMLRHPLVYCVPYTEMQNALLNQSFAAKTEALQRARFEQNFHQYVYLFERPWRLTAFLDISHEIPDDQFWDVLGSIWTDSENIHQMRDEWVDILDGSYAEARGMMDDADRKYLERQPERLTVYRGFTTRSGEQGLSWTLDFSVANFFAKRFGSQSFIARGYIDKSKVLAFFSGRSESEIVALWRDVEDITVRNVHQWWQCPECKRVFDLQNDSDMDEFSHGHDCEA